ncbi:hypothetical protein D3C87_1389780 [compost metagenome]
MKIWLAEGEIEEVAGLQIAGSDRAGHRRVIVGTQNFEIFSRNEGVEIYVSGQVTSLIG